MNRSLVGVYSPWGTVDWDTPIADGINSVSTPSHGGIKLDRKRNAQIPVSMRRKGGWYEEDCDWAIPAMVFKSEFKPEQVESAAGTLKNWFPAFYTELTGQEVPTEDSITLREEKFYRDHINDYVATAAWGDWHPTVPKGMVGVHAVLGGRTPSGQYHSDNHKWFLVPDHLYSARGFGFVCDLSFQAWEGHP